MRPGPDDEVAPGADPTPRDAGGRTPAEQPHGQRGARGPVTDDDERAAAIERLRTAWRGEIEARLLYTTIADRERDPRRAELLRELADAEAGHRRRLEQRMRELGAAVPDPAGVRISRWARLQARVAPLERVLAAREAAENDEVEGVYGRPTGDAETDRLLAEIRADEDAHSRSVRVMIDGRTGATAPPGESPDARALSTRDGRASGGSEQPPARMRLAAEQTTVQTRLDRILGRERWHSGGGGWISGAIYGANDGLAAVFGIVAGVSGATGGNKIVLTAGLAGAIASALSMATGAFLAERSQMEVVAANLQQERREIAEHPEEEREELSLFYQLKGLDKATADSLAADLAKQPEAMLAVLAAEEFGSTSAQGNPTQAALAGGLSTAAGAIVPVIPYFFITGTIAFVIAAAVSLAAHFLVGALKSLVTLRSWWASGLEMTLAGMIVGGALYGIGVALPVPS